MKYLKTYKLYENYNWWENLSNLEPIRQDVEDIFIGVSDRSNNIQLDVHLTTVQGYRRNWSSEGIRPQLVIEIIGAEPGGGYAMERNIYNEIKDSYNRTLEYIKSVLIENNSYLGWVNNKVEYSLNTRDTIVGRHVVYPHRVLKPNTLPPDFRKLKISILLFEK